MRDAVKAALLVLVLWLLWRSLNRQAAATVSGGTASGALRDYLGSGSSVGDALNNFLSGVSDVMSGLVKRSAEEVVEAWAAAIKKHEGYFPGSRSYRNNNPGNLRVTGDKGRDKDGFGIFSSYELGWQALKADLRAKLRKYPSMTVAQIMERYAPSVENDSKRYAQVVASALGVSTETTLADLYSA